MRKVSLSVSNIFLEVFFATLPLVNANNTLLELKQAFCVRKFSKRCCATMKSVFIYEIRVMT